MKQLIKVKELIYSWKIRLDDQKKLPKVVTLIPYLKNLTSIYIYGKKKICNLIKGICKNTNIKRIKITVRNGKELGFMNTLQKRLKIKPDNLFCELYPYKYKPVDKKKDSGWSSFIKKFNKNQRQRNLFIYYDDQVCQNGQLEETSRILFKQNGNKKK